MPDISPFYQSIDQPFYNHFYLDSSIGIALTHQESNLFLSMPNSTIYGPIFKKIEAALIKIIKN